METGKEGGKEKGKKTKGQIEKRKCIDEGKKMGKKAYRGRGGK